MYNPNLLCPTCQKPFLYISDYHVCAEHDADFIADGLGVELPPVQEIENIFALLDEPAEQPLTPNQLKAEALLALEHEACFHNAIIRAHREGSVCLAGPTLNESRLARAQARMAQREYFV